MVLVASERDSALITLPHGDVVLFVPTFGAFDHVRRLLTSLEGTIPADVPVLITDDAYPHGELLPRVRDLLETSQLSYYHVRNAENRGFGRSCNDAFVAAERADVVICNSDLEVFPGWFNGLKGAANSSNLVASASALGSNASILSIPIGGNSNQSIDWAAAAARLAEQPAWSPEIPTAVGHLMYLKRRALSVIGTFDERYNPGYGEEVQWSQRAVAAGFHHVAADTVLVLHEAGASFSQNDEWYGLQDRHELLIAQDFPNYHGAIRAFLARLHSPLMSALLRASVIARGLHVRVDLRGLGTHLTGSGVGAKHATKALCALDSISRIDVVVEDYYLDFFRTELHPMSVLAESEVHRSMDRADVVFRPQQFRNTAEIEMAARVGHRLCFEQLDFIAYSNPTYFDNAELWDQYREATETAYAVASGVAFNSEFVNLEAERFGFIRSGSVTAVAQVGIDHFPAEIPGQLSDQLCAKLGDSYLLVQGASFQHKNRIFAIRLFDRLVEVGYRGNLVLAGPDPQVGSSRLIEAEWIRSRPSLAARIIYLPWVPDDQLHAVIANADLLLYPTVSEGFGLLPLEAARLGTAALTANSASLGDIFKETTRFLHLDSIDDSVEAISEMLGSEEVRHAHVNEYLAIADSYKWRTVATNLANLFVDVVQTPARAEIDAVVRGLATDRSHRVKSRISRNLGSFRRSSVGSSLFPQGSRQATYAREFLGRYLPV